MNATNSEQWVISCLLIDPNLIKITRLQKKHFTIEVYKQLFDVLDRMSKEWLAIDVLSVSSYTDVVNKDELYDLSCKVITTVNFDTYENLIIEKYNKQLVVDCINKIENNKENLDYNDIEKMLYNAMSSIEQKNKVDTMFPWVYATMDLYFNSEDNPIYVTDNTWYAQLDFFLWGVRQWWLYILAARPKVWKSSVMLNLCMKLREQKINTSVHSFEMSAQEIHERAICMTCEVEAWQLHKRVTDVIEKVTDIMGKIKEKSRCYIHTGSMLHEIERNIAQDVYNWVKVIFIDYLQLIRIDWYKGNKNNMIEEITRKLKILAGEYGIAIFLLSQLSREASKVAEPELHHLRDSWAIEQDATAVIFLARDEYNKTMDLSVKANRHGECGQCSLPYVNKYFKMMNW